MYLSIYQSIYLSLYLSIYIIYIYYIHIRRQYTLENKPNNNDKTIIKTRCYFLIIFCSLPLLFQNKCVNKLH